jgi:sulfatase modifying factor 1
MFKHLIPGLVLLLFVVTNCSSQEGSSEQQALLFERASEESNTEINPPLKMGEVPNNIPEGMIYVPSGKTTIGSENGMEHERPTFTVNIEPIFMDKHPVTVGEFRKFVNATGYVTYSDEIGDGIVFDFQKGEWIIAPGVNWEYPLGRDNSKAPDDHPLTLLTYDDAEAYLNWVGKRLPTEIEWEHAARGLTNRNTPYAWGDKLIVDGRYMANTWNGEFPINNNVEDDFLTTAPVGFFGETELGLTDMGGNVWEWTSSWFRSYSNRDKPFIPSPESQKVLRGGSFLCHASYCHGYRVSARSKTPPSNNMFHIGFRGVKDVK